MIRRMQTVCVVLAITLSASQSRLHSGEPLTTLEPDVVYGHKDGLALTLDCFRPESKADGAAVLFMVSGGWVSKWAPPEQMKPFFRPFLDEGFTVFAVRHGSSPRYTIPEAVSDVRTAVRFVRRHADRFHIDADRLGVFGMSAGGHLSLMLGTTGDDGDPSATSELEMTPSRVAAVVAFVPPTDLRVAVWDAPESLPAYRAFPALNLDLEKAQVYSPLVHVSPDDAPALVIMGGKDELVPPRHGRWIDEAFERENVQRKLIVYPDAGHGLEGNQAAAIKEAVTWFNTNLRNTQTQALTGSWRVVSVEMAGAAIPGLTDATLVFERGKKTFTLPDGRVERGTYELNAMKVPNQIDSTTEGTDGTDKGIYQLDGDKLKLCLSSDGNPRPRKFSTENSGHLLIVLRRATAKPKDDRAPPTKAAPSTAVKEVTGPRTFRMGFTGFVYDTSLEAVTASREFVQKNGDILAHHIEGVPWAESLHNKPFSDELLEEWKAKRSATPPDGKVYLAISPGRGELKLAEKAAPLPDELKGKQYDDPLVQEAFLSYCRRAIRFFKPDYLSIGIETNEIHDRGPAVWRAYVELHQHAYEELKKEHPDLPIFASWTLHNMFNKQGDMLKDWKKLMPYNDLVAASYYPFFVEDKDRLDPLDWMITQFDSFNKPFAIVETNDAAERLRLPQANVVIEGTTEKQEAYYRKLLALAQEREFEFVISFVHQDYDALWEKIKSNAPELFMAWRDCGLLDESGRERPAYAVWKKYFDRSFSQN